MYSNAVLPCMITSNLYTFSGQQTHLHSSIALYTVEFFFKNIVFCCLHVAQYFVMALLPPLLEQSQQAFLT